MIQFFKDLAALVRGNVAAVVRRFFKPDPGLVKRMQLLAKTGNCGKATTEWKGEQMFCEKCIMHRSEKVPAYWDCTNEGESAKRWLAEHGIKE